MTSTHVRLTRHLDIAMGKYLIALRESQGLSRQEMADIIGLTYNSLGNREAGIKSITLTDLHTFATYFKVHPSDILSIVEQNILKGRR